VVWACGAVVGVGIQPSTCPTWVDRRVDVLCSNSLPNWRRTRRLFFLVYSYSSLVPLQYEEINKFVGVAAIAR